VPPPCKKSGFDGAGVKVAVLDSGIDYTHAKLGGAGSLRVREQRPDYHRTGTFPTAKVVGGHYWFGSECPEMPDPDPIDDGPDGGHGTHVADGHRWPAHARSRRACACPCFA
jgi:subtilisin family serine protease